MGRVKQAKRKRPGKKSKATSAKHKCANDMSSPLGLFGRLPREIRDQIYEDCCVSSVTVLRHRNVRCGPLIEYVRHPDARTCRLPTLAGTCKTLYRELLQVGNLHAFHEVGFRLGNSLCDVKGLKFKDAQKADRLYVQLLANPKDLRCMAGHPPGKVSQRFRDEVRCVLSAFPKVTRLAIEVGEEDLMVNSGKDHRHQHDSYAAVINCHSDVTKLQEVSLIVLPGMTGAYYIKDAEGWKLVASNCVFTEKGVPSFIYPGCGPYAEPKAWLRFLQDFDASSALQAFVQEWRNHKEWYKSPSFTKFVQHLNDYWNAGANRHGMGWAVQDGLAEDRWVDA